MGKGELIPFIFLFKFFLKWYNDIMNKFKYIIGFIVIVLLLIINPYMANIRSYMIIYPYSKIFQYQSTLWKNDIVFDIQGGNITKEYDWYPFVITFNDDEGVSSYLGEDVDFTVLFNFGAFEKTRGSSSYYNPESPYYGSFYGGYVIKPKKDKKFGFFYNGELNMNEISKILQYDQLHLVMPSIGCPYKDREFKETVLSAEYNVKYLGYDNWIKIDSDIRTNGPLHKYKSFQRGYLQYGIPNSYNHQKDYPIENFHGRAYIRYFEEYNATFVLYIMAPEWETVNISDREILSQSIIKDKNQK